MTNINKFLKHSLAAGVFLCFISISAYAHTGTGMGHHTGAGSGAGQGGPGQTPLNIGASLDLVGGVFSEDNDEGQKGEFELRAFELNIGAPVDPYWDMFVAFGYHEGEFDLEEAWVSTVLPFNFKLTVGRELLPFGYLNRKHEHDFPQIDQPYVIEGLTTDHGMIGDGGHIEYLTPLINPTLTLSVGAYQDIGHSVGRRIDGTPVVSRAHSYFQSPGGNHELLIGGSFLTGFGGRDRMEDRLDDAGETDDDRALGKTKFLAGFDFKYRYTPGGQTYRGLTIAGEYLYADYDPYENHTDFDPNDNLGSDHGLYAYVQWDFNRFRGAGYRFDYTDVLFSYQIDSKKLTAHSVYGIWRATEFSMLKVQYQYVDDPREDKAEHRGLIQGVFFLGWHPPHRF